MNQFIFLRHGETDWNLKGWFQGQNDIELNNHGRSQAIIAANILHKINFDCLYTSPLSRAKETAAIIKEQLTNNIPLVELDGLGECHSEVVARLIYNGFARTKLPLFDHETDKTESPDLFLLRIKKAINEIFKNESTFPLIVAHGGTYWAICEIIGIKANDIHNCQPVLFKKVDGEWSQKVI